MKIAENFQIAILYENFHVPTYYLYLY